MDPSKFGVGQQGSTGSHIYLDAGLTIPASSGLYAPGTVGNMEGVVQAFGAFTNGVTASGDEDFIRTILNGVGTETVPRFKIHKSFSV